MPPNSGIDLDMVTTISANTDKPVEESTGISRFILAENDDYTERFIADLNQLREVIHPVMMDYIDRMASGESLPSMGSNFSAITGKFIETGEKLSIIQRRQKEENPVDESGLSADERLGIYNLNNALTAIMERDKKVALKEEAEAEHERLQP